MKPPTHVYHRNLIFVLGKGGVGKTTLSQALALALSKNKKVLWICFEDPTRTAGELSPAKNGNSRLWELNVDPTEAFEEYAELKIKQLSGSFLSSFGLVRTFLDNKLIRYLAKAAPGIRELVLLGKVWHERTHYDHVVVDMPSTGYGVAMFQSAANFLKLFGSGPLAKDASRMLETFKDPVLSGYWIAALPEEMPLREARELDGLLGEMFPNNPSEFVVNRVFPKHSELAKKSAEKLGPPDQWETPFALNIADYAARRSALETHNLKMWSDLKYSEIRFISPREAPSDSALVQKLADQIQADGMLP
jgi:energy-coupling factor transporter ATP-binding protein EcfA2